jgi:A118 family predicted phage portal protein
MALPDNNTAFPPVQLQGVTEKYREHSAWYSGDQNELATVYQPAPTGKSKNIFTRFWRWFAGERPETGEAAQNHIQMPLAPEMARKSASLVFSKPVTVRSKEKADTKSAAQDRLDLIFGAGFEATMATAAESSAALGGIFLRTVWDRSLTDHAFIGKVDADAAVPFFRHGYLLSVQFWEVVESNDSVVWRHVEEHDVDEAGIGIIRHALYQGTQDNVGRRLKLEDHEKTAGHAAIVDENGVISTLTPGLSAVYAPNQTPSAVWRNHPVGAYLGRSDFEGVEQLLDARNKTVSTLMRELELSKGRLIVSESALDDFGVGEGSGFDLDRTVFTPIKSSGITNLDDDSVQIEKVQFEIHSEDILRIDDFFKRQIVTAAGYSPATFGMTDGTKAMTATEIVASQSETLQTRERKVRNLKHPMEVIGRKTLAVDAAIFDTGVTEFDIEIIFADAVQPDPKSIAEQNAMDATSQSASIRTRVIRAHADWSPKQVDDEVAAILAENQAAPTVQQVDPAAVKPPTEQPQAA